MNETTVEAVVIEEIKAPTFATIMTGDKVEIGHKGKKWTAIFLGFSDDSERYSKTPVFDCWDDLQAGKNVKSWKALQTHQDHMESTKSGFRVQALFRDVQIDPAQIEAMENDAEESVSDPAIWASFLHNGRWSYGSDRLAMRIYRQID